MISNSAYLEHELVFGEALHRLQEVGTERQGVAGLRLAPPQHRRGVLLPAQLVDGPDAVKIQVSFCTRSLEVNLAKQDPSRAG